MSLPALAQQMAQRGRNGDTVLVHMTPREVAGLQGLAMAHGGSLTINPDTGLPEANFLKKILPAAAGFLLGPAGFGLMSSGMAALTVGGIGALTSGSLSKGLMMGLGAYGGSELGAAFMDSGLGGAASAGGSSGLAPQVTPSAAGSTSLGEAFKAAKPDWLTGAGQAADTLGSGTFGVSAPPISAVNLTPPAAAATVTPPPPVPTTPATFSGRWDAVTQGFKNAATAPGDFLKANKWAAMGVAAPLLTEGLGEQPGLKMPPQSPSYIRSYDFDPRTRRLMPISTVDASSIRYSPRDDNYAEGGQVSDLSALETYLRNNPTSPLTQQILSGALNRAPTSEYDFLTGDSAAAYDYLMGRSPYPRRSRVPDGTETREVTNTFQKPAAPAPAPAVDNGGVTGGAGDGGGPGGVDGGGGPGVGGGDPGGLAAAASLGLGALGDLGLTALGMIGNAISGSQDPNNVTVSDATPSSVGAGTTGPGSASGIGVGSNIGINGMDAQSDAATAAAADAAGGNTGPGAAVGIGVGSTSGINGMDAQSDAATAAAQAAAQAAQSDADADADADGVSTADDADASAAVGDDGDADGIGIGIGIGDGLGGMGDAAAGIAAADGVGASGIGEGSTGSVGVGDSAAAGVAAADGVGASGIGEGSTGSVGGGDGGGGGGSGGACFLTTAAVKHMGQDDDGEVLNTLRDFRDTYMRKNKEKSKDVAWYYQNAPKIVAALDERPDAERLYRVMYKNYIEPAYEAIKEGKDDRAYTIYKEGIDFAKRASGIEKEKLAPRYGRNGMAVGGLANLPAAGMAGGPRLAAGGRFLRGAGDGVSDSIPAVIEGPGGVKPARLADGEFVIPARIVSELGNGSSEAGARKLYSMMDRVQNARRKSVGKDKVAVNSRADKHLPA